MFGSAWKAEDGVVRFENSAGHLKEEIDGAREGNPWVTFFERKNPGYAHGEELVCLTEMSDENLRKVALAAFREGPGIKP